MDPQCLFTKDLIQLVRKAGEQSHLQYRFCINTTWIFLCRRSMIFWAFWPSTFYLFKTLEIFLSSSWLCLWVLFLCALLYAVRKVAFCSLHNIELYVECKHLLFQDWTLPWPQVTGDSAGLAAIALDIFSHSLNAENFSKIKQNKKKNKQQHQQDTYCLLSSYRGNDHDIFLRFINTFILHHALYLHFHLLIPLTLHFSLPIVNCPN